MGCCPEALHGNPSLRETQLWESRLPAEFMNYPSTWGGIGEDRKVLWTERNGAWHSGVSRTPYKRHTELTLSWCHPAWASKVTHMSSFLVSSPGFQIHPTDGWGTLNIFPTALRRWLSPSLLKRHKCSFLFERGSLFTVIRYLKTLISRLCWPSHSAVSKRESFRALSLPLPQHRSWGLPICICLPSLSLLTKLLT